MMNSISIIGRLTKKPELRFTQNQKAVCDFTIACNRINGDTDFILCQCWGVIAQNLNKYQDKGSLVAINGRLCSDSFEVNGEKKYKTYILVNQLEFLTSKGKTEKVESDPYLEYAKEQNSELPF